MNIITCKSTRRTRACIIYVCQYFFTTTCVSCSPWIRWPFDHPFKYSTIKWCKEKINVTQFAIWIKVMHFHNLRLTIILLYFNINIIIWANLFKVINTWTICPLHISRFGIQREKAGLWLAIQCNGTMRN